MVSLRYLLLVPRARVPKTRDGYNIAFRVVFTDGHSQLREADVRHHRGPLSIGCRARGAHPSKKLTFSEPRGMVLLIVIGCKNGALETAPHLRGRPIGHFGLWGPLD
jgi:hypothetical protein